MVAASTAAAGDPRLHSQGGHQQPGTRWDLVRAAISSGRPCPGPTCAGLAVLTSAAAVMRALLRP